MHRDNRQNDLRKCVIHTPFGETNNTTWWHKIEQLFQQRMYSRWIFHCLEWKLISPKMYWVETEVSEKNLSKPGQKFHGVLPNTSLVIWQNQPFNYVNASAIFTSCGMAAVTEIPIVMAHVIWQLKIVTARGFFVLFFCTLSEQLHKDELWL